MEVIDVIQKVRKLLGLDWEVKVQHSYRESNRCANVLVNIGCSMRELVRIIFIVVLLS
jgi:hypothetical protein